MSRALLCYVFGLVATFIGAALTEPTASMWPLALGGATSIMCTVPVVARLLEALRTPPR